MALFASKRNNDKNVLRQKLADIEMKNISQIIDQGNFIGGGSYAEVYKVNWSGSVLAMKKYKHNLSEKKVLLLCEKIRHLSHKNIVQLRGFSVIPTVLAIEFCSVEVDGNVMTNLRQLLDCFNENQYYEWSERLIYCLEASEGLKYLHDNGIIYQDLKPSNMLVTGNLQKIIIKLSDFGELSTIKNTAKTTTRISENYQGMTLAYLPPEVCTRKIIRPDERTDVYALAISIFEILSGESNPWEKSLPILTDVMLMKALDEGVRPNTDCLSEIYCVEQVFLLRSLLEHIWCEEMDRRFTTEKVCWKIILLKYIPKRCL